MENAGSGRRRRASLLEEREQILVSAFHVDSPLTKSLPFPSLDVLPPANSFNLLPLSFPTWLCMITPPWHRPIRFPPTQARPSPESRVPPGTPRSLPPALPTYAFADLSVHPHHPGPNLVIVIPPPPGTTPEP